MTATGSLVSSGRRRPRVRAGSKPEDQLERLPLGTPYPQVVERVGRMTDQVRVRPAAFVDATGVGQPWVDLLRERVQSGVVVPVTFTERDRRTERWDGVGI